MRKTEVLRLTTAIKLAVVGVGSSVIADTAYAQPDAVQTPIDRENTFPRDIILFDSARSDKRVNPSVPQTVYAPTCTEQTANPQGFRSKGRLQLKVK